MNLKESTAQESAYQIVRIFLRMQKEVVHIRTGSKGNVIVKKVTLAKSKRLQNQTLKKETIRAINMETKRNEEIHIKDLLREEKDKKKMYRKKK